MPQQPKTITATFTGVTFNDPNFPLGEDINGEFTCKADHYWPPDRKSWSYESSLNPDGVRRFVRVIEGLAPNVYHQIVMELNREITGEPTHESLVFSAQQPTLPVTNTEQYGGTATVI